MKESQLNQLSLLSGLGSLFVGILVLLIGLLILIVTTEEYEQNHKTLKDPNITCEQTHNWDYTDGYKYDVGMCITNLDETKVVKQNFTSNGDQSWYYSSFLFDDYYNDEYLTKNSFEHIYVAIKTTTDPNYNQKVDKKYFKELNNKSKKITAGSDDNEHNKQLIDSMYQDAIDLEINNQDIIFKVAVDEQLNQGLTLDEALYKIDPRIGHLNSGKFTYDQHEGIITFNNN